MSQKIPSLIFKDKKNFLQISGFYVFSIQALNVLINAVYETFIENFGAMYQHDAVNPSNIEHTRVRREIRRAATS